MTDAAGWYGKLPALGDFASRRLDADWIARWDEWLAAGLARLQAQRPQQWLDDYLASPAWRFALWPGAIAGDADFRVGVLVPSVDRVGRYFPLAITSPPIDPPATITACVRLWAWCAELEEIAVAAMRDDWSADAVDAALLQRPRPAEPIHPAIDPAIDETDEVSTWFAGIAAHAAWQGLSGQSLWLSGNTPAGAIVCQGLPQHDDFDRLFSPRRI
jgi:type VI secretion system protein ImpM